LLSDAGGFAGSTGGEGGAGAGAGAAAVGAALFVFDGGFCACVGPRGLTTGGDFPAWRTGSRGAALGGVGAGAGVAFCFGGTCSVLVGGLAFCARAPGAAMSPNPIAHRIRPRAKREGSRLRGNEDVRNDGACSTCG
jgi:hypothetical protein